MGKWLAQLRATQEQLKRAHAIFPTGKKTILKKASEECLTGTAQWSVSAVHGTARFLEMSDRKRGQLGWTGGSVG